MSAEDLQLVICDTLEAAAADKMTLELVQLQSLRPARPTPTQRYPKVVS